MKIGVHPNNLHLRLASVWPGAFAGSNPQFIHYGEGRDTARLLQTGRIDFGGTGSTPPIGAEAQGLPVAYIAASAPRPANGAILVRHDSSIGDAADLAGRAVSLIDGSFHTYLLARSLEAVGLSLADVSRIESGDSDSQQDLLDGRVDAWVTMSPRLEPALQHPELRLLVRCGSTIPNRSLFWSLAQQRLSEDDRSAIASELHRIGQAATADIERASGLLAEAAGNRAGNDAASWARVLRSRDLSVAPIDAAILAEQQDEADTLLRHGHFEQAVTVRQAGH